MYVKIYAINFLKGRQRSGYFIINTFNFVLIVIIYLLTYLNVKALIKLIVWNKLSSQIKKSLSVHTIKNSKTH